jgi:hypothetical protein
VINAFLFFSDMSSDIDVKGVLSFLFMYADAPWFAGHAQEELGT